MTERILRRFFLTSLTLYSLVAVLQIALQSGTLQWDLKTYYYAGKSFLAGLDPYSPVAVPGDAGDQVMLGFVYPPYTLWIFAILTLLPYQISSVLFLIAKILALVALLFLWKREFLSTESNTLFYPLCLLGFAGAIHRDFVAGNISVFEQLGLWLSFWFFLKNNLRAFCLALILTAAFKITPILFLSLLWFSDHPKRFSYFWGSLGAFLLLLLISFTMSPGLFQGFLSNLDLPPGEGAVNPSTYQFFVSGFSFAGRHSGISFPPFLPGTLYGIAVVAILAAARKRVASLLSAPSSDRLKALIFFICLVYALILPRFKDYSFILLLVPSYFIFLRSTVVPSSTLLVVLSMLSPLSTLPGFTFTEPLWKYYPLLLAFLVFFLYLSETEFPDSVSTSRQRTQ